MITTPEEYKHVDFADGTMPTGRINGSILPLRTIGKDDPHKPGEVDVREMLKGEDIAFLYEAAAERVNVFDGAKDQWYYGEYHVDPAVTALTPDRRLSADQMNSVIAMVNRIAKTKTYKAIPFEFNLMSDFSTGEVISNINRDGTAIKDFYENYMMSHLRDDSPIAEVIRGDKVEMSKISELFGRIKSDSRRVFSLFPYGEHGAENYTMVANMGAARAWSLGTYDHSLAVVGELGSFWSDNVGWYLYVCNRRKVVDFAFSTPSIKKIYTLLSVLNHDRPTYGTSDQWYLTTLIDATSYFEVVKTGGRTEVYLSAPSSFELVKAFFQKVGMKYPFDYPPRPESYYDSDVEMRLFIELDNDYRTKWW